MRGRRRWVILGIAFAGLTLSTLAALAAARYYPAYRSALAARDDLREAQSLLQERRLDVSAADLLTAEERLDDAERGFRQTREALDDPLLSAGRFLPLLGGLLTATADLTDIGIEGVQLGRDAVAMSRTYQRLRDEEDGSLTERTEEILTEIEPTMTSIMERLDYIRQKRGQVTGVVLPPPLVSAVGQMDADMMKLEELVHTYSDLADFLPDFLGFNGPRTYLVLAQNNAELLPTGGLISVYGLITMEEGRVQEKRFEDAVSFGGRWLERSDTYIEPPAPLKRYLLKDMSWNFAVSNWSPHFPTAAQEAERFFLMAGGRPVDGVIAINVNTIEELLAVTGPIAVEPYGVTVSAENALEVIEAHTRAAQQEETDRKAFVGVLAEALLSRLMHTPSEEWTRLIDALERLRDQRQVLAFFHDRKMQMLAHRLGLDGALKMPDGDYFMLVDASVNSTKLNMVLEEQIDLVVRVDALGTAYHKATISYRNNLPAWAEGRDPLLVQRLMLGGTYGGYVRLLAPHGSLLEDVTLDGREVGPEELSVERGKAVFGRFFSVASGQTAEVAFHYSTPFAVRYERGLAEYRLYLQKQSGTDALPVRIQIALPDGAEIDSALLDGQPVDALGGITTDLAKDRELVVRYRLDRRD